MGQQVAQGELALALLQGSHLREVIGQKVVHPAKVSLLDGDSHQRPGERLGAGVQRKHAAFVIAFLVIFVDQDSVLGGDHGVDLRAGQHRVQLLEQRRVHAVALRRVELPAVVRLRFGLQIRFRFRLS